MCFQSYSQLCTVAHQIEEAHHPWDTVVGEEDGVHYGLKLRRGLNHVLDVGQADERLAKGDTGDVLSEDLHTQKGKLPERSSHRQGKEASQGEA